MARLTCRVLALSFVTLAFSGCSILSPDCPMDLGVSLQPSSATIAVGESVTASAALTGCGGRERITDTMRWQTADTAVVRVDSVAGRITGVRAGSATVSVRGARYGDLGAVAVTVR